MATYAYAVCRDDPGLGTVVAGVEGLGMSLRLVCENELAAIACDAPPQRLRPSRKNLLSHEAVLRRLYDFGPVVPMRFGQVFPDDEVVRGELLRPHARRLSDLLRRVERHAELHVKLSYDEDALLVRALDEARRAPGTAARFSRYEHGQTLDDRIRFGELAVEAIDRACERDGSNVLAALRGHASEVVVHSPGKQAAPFRAAFLVPEAERPAFDAALERVTANLPDGASIGFISPLLPYSFVDIQGG
jgi:hypothetical protein